MKVIHIITGLNDGGAEAVLYRLCKNDSENKHVVISMMDEGKYGPLLKEIGIDVYTLNMPAGRVSFSGLIKLFRLIKKISPDVVQTWMYHADFIGGIVARLAGVKSIFWGVHHSSLEKEHNKRSTLLIARLNSILSYLIPTKIVCCADRARVEHERIGYKKSKLTVINNGYELDSFKFIEDAQTKLKNELEINPDVFLGMVSRYHPLKDHHNLLQALSIVRGQIPNFVCVLVGTGLDGSNRELIEKIDNLQLSDHILLLGQRNDIPKIMSALDVHLLSSRSEGFPNVLSEAMACGTPCITTDVGDASVIVGDTGWVVPAQNPEALANAIVEAIKEKKDMQSWQLRKNACREHIVSNFSIEEMIKQYHSIWSA